MSRFLHSRRDDRGVVASELVLAMPFIVALIACSITLAGLFQTKTRVAGAARDAVRSFVRCEEAVLDDSRQSACVPLRPASDVPLLQHGQPAACPRRRGESHSVIARVVAPVESSARKATGD